MTNELPRSATVDKAPPKEKLSTINWNELRQKTAEFIQHEARLVAMFLTLMAVASPQVLASETDFEETICSMRQVIIEDAQTTTITCLDAEGNETQVNLEFIINSYDVTTYKDDQMDNPPFFTSEYLSNLQDPNFNCHSETLQRIEKALGIDFGANRQAWLDSGLDVFLQEFGEEVVRLDEIPDEMTEDVIDTSNVLAGDVVLFFDENGKLIHSATAVQQLETEEGVTYWQIANKLGASAELGSSIDDMVLLYDINNALDDLPDAKTGSIVMYRIDAPRLQSLMSD